MFRRPLRRSVLRPYAARQAVPAVPGVLPMAAVASVPAAGSAVSGARRMYASEPVTPWYVAEAQKHSTQAQEGPAELPELPENSPQSLEAVVAFAVKDMGLKDVVVLDRRNEDAALGPSLLVVGTGLSAKHLSSSGAVLMTWLKRAHDAAPVREGVLTTNFLRLHRRRQKRRQQRHRGTKHEDTLEKTGSWIAVDTKLDGIYVHVMTADRRAEVDLESLAVEGNEFDENFEEVAKLEEAYADPSRPAKSGSGRRQFSTVAAGRRYHSTEAKSTLPDSNDSDLSEVTREKLALDNLAEAARDDITEDSPEVLDFTENFPDLPSRQDWKHRLNFFALASTQSSLFPPARVVAEALLQQESGYVLDTEDIETVVSAVCYHGQAHFAAQPAGDEAHAAWQDLCDTKGSLLMKLLDASVLPQGRGVLDNPRLLVLLYRTFTGPTAHSTTPLQALATTDELSSSSDSSATNSTNIDTTTETDSTKSADKHNRTPGLEVFANYRRLVPLRYLVEGTSEMASLPTVGMLLTSLCTRTSAAAFWKTADVAMLAARDTDSRESLVALVLALVVRSGDTQQIRHAVLTYLPNYLVNRQIRLTQGMVRSIEAGLAVVDAERQPAYASVRRIMQRFHAGALN